jgi:hypothetical protein
MKSHVVYKRLKQEGGSLRITHNLRVGREVIRTTRAKEMLKWAWQKVDEKTYKALTKAVRLKENYEA